MYNIIKYKLKSKVNVMKMAIFLYSIQILLFIIILVVQKTRLKRLKYLLKISKECNKNLIYIYSKEVENKKVH